MFNLVERPLLVARCTKIIDKSPEDSHYLITLSQMGKYVVELGEVYFVYLLFSFILIILIIFLFFDYFSFF